MLERIDFLNRTNAINQVSSFLIAVNILIKFGEENLVKMHKPTGGAGGSKG